MRIIKVQGFEGTDFEAEARKCKVVKVEPSGNWSKVFYKVPRGKKIYAMFLKTDDIEC